jgi:N-acetylglucosamine-6-sulfatase
MGPSPRTASRRLVCLFLVGLGFVANSLAADAVTARTAPLGLHANAAGARPNIVVFMLDDVNPHDGRLWNNATRTPSLTGRFVEHGIEFANAIAETPICCPGRTGFLTGLHTHNHHVTRNKATLFKPGMHIGKAMSSAGYSTMLIGKYLNAVTSFSSSQWAAHGAGWTYLDVFDEWNGAFYNYWIHTKEGRIYYDDVHSTRMIAQRSISRMRQTPPDKPIFAVLTPYNLHNPNKPLPEFVGDERCGSVPRWNPPNYNEADVSDKPSWVRELPLLKSTQGWRMRRYCEEMLGIDWLVSRVAEELRDQGRLDNTLFVFTADNGMGWGSHRVGQKKLLPYTTPIPLYMWWPSGFGNDARVIKEVVSNIDLAPTFCELAGCVLSGYPDGQDHPDGVSLLPLLDGRAGQLNRDAVLETAWTAVRTWAGIRTSHHHSLGRWHYVEWANGDRELYDLAADPWELVNRVTDPSLRDVRNALAAELEELRREGEVT